MSKNIDNTIDSNLGMFSIDAVAKILNVHQRTLRIYDAEGILVPKRSSGNRRLYSLNDIQKGKDIKTLTRNLGIDISGVKFILAMFKDTKLDQSEYSKYINKIAKKANFDLKTQEINIKKAKNRGRKPKSTKN